MQFRWFELKNLSVVAVPPGIGWFLSARDESRFCLYLTQLRSLDRGIGNAKNENFSCGLPKPVSGVGCLESEETHGGAALPGYKYFPGAPKPVIARQNLSCFLTLTGIFWLPIAASGLAMS